jgi:hypothetical protein
MPSRSKIRRTWRTGFYISGWTIVRTVAWRWSIFKHKKGSATICLGLIFCSMGSSQPPTRDTVPLNNSKFLTIYNRFWGTGSVSVNFFCNWIRFSLKAKAKLKSKNSHKSFWKTCLKSGRVQKNLRREERQLFFTVIFPNTVPVPVQDIKYRFLQELISGGRQAGPKSRKNLLGRREDLLPAASPAANSTVLAVPLPAGSTPEADAAASRSSRQRRGRGVGGAGGGGGGGGQQRGSISDTLANNTRRLDTVPVPAASTEVLLLLDVLICYQ